MFYYADQRRLDAGVVSRMPRRAARWGRIAGGHVGGIFISYRHSHERGVFVKDLGRQLVEHFGEALVFLDTESIRAGRDFSVELTHRLEDCDVVVAIIHPGWITELRHADEDWVRTELELALDFGKPVIPLLLDGARLPTVGDLPPTISKLSLRQAVKVERGTPGPQLGRLIECLEPDVLTWIRGSAESAEPTPPRPWVGGVAAAAARAALVAPWVFLPDDLVAREVAHELWAWPLLLMLAPLAAVTVISWTGRSLDAGEQVVQDLSLGRYFLRVALPLGVFGAGTTFAMVREFPLLPTPVLLLAVTVATACLIVTILGHHKEELRRENEWPQTLAAPIRAAHIRQELARLDRKLRELTSGQRFLPRRDRLEQAMSQSRHLMSAGNALRVDAARGRWRWLTSDHPWIVIAAGVWVAGAVGLVAALALPTSDPWWPIGAAAFAASVAAVTVEMAYRHQRERRLAVVHEVGERNRGMAKTIRDLADRRL
jgi:hypothetical protein